MNLVLIGYRGTGKTAVAQQLAERLACDWADTDNLIEQAQGMSIANIFAEQGEAVFRDLETKQLQGICQQEGLILSVGGGAILRGANRDLLRDYGRIVWLTASPRTLWRRIKNDSGSADRRPNLTNSGGLTEIQQVLTQRTPIYRACADWVVDTEDRNPSEVAAEIERLLAAEPSPSDGADEASV